MVANMLNGASDMRFKMNGNVYPLIFILHGLALCKPYMNLMWSHLSQPHFGAKCENATHIPKSGKTESSGTPKNSEDDLKGQISSP